MKSDEVEAILDDPDGLASLEHELSAMEDVLVEEAMGMLNEAEVARITADLRSGNCSLMER